jgi:hypothetical protein
MTDQAGRVQTPERAVSAYLYSVGAEKPDTWAAEIVATLRAFGDAAFLGGLNEHHCIEQQGCRVCAVSEFLRGEFR